MKKLLIFSLIAFLVHGISFATIRRVGYAGLQSDGIDFPSVQSAHDASSPGDTIQVYGSTTSATITKKIVLMGFGYNLGAHPGLQATSLNYPSNVALSFSGGSDGSIATGLSGSFNISEGATGNHDTVSDITFLRCFGTFDFYNRNDFGLISNIRILSSVITSGRMVADGDADYAVNNLEVFNSIINSFSLYKSSTTASFINCVMPSPILNSNLSLNLTMAKALVKNCIISAAGTSTNVNTVYENTFFAELQPVPLPAGTNNRWGQDWTVLFNRINTNNDNASNPSSTEFDENYYILKAGSPAAGGGRNLANEVTNCGIFGGELIFAYRPSGIPAVPSIYKLTAPATAATTNPYNVTISVRSNN